MAGRGRRSGFILIVLALIIILGVVAGYLLLQQNLLQPVVQAEDDLPPAPLVETVDILVTTQNIPRGAALSQDVLATIPYPKTEMIEGMFFTDMEDLLGKRVTSEVPNGVPLTASMIADTDAMMPAYPSFDIPDSYTAVSMPISKLTSVSYGVQPGDHVMVVGCMLLLDVDTEFQSRLPDDTTRVINPGLLGESGATANTASIENPEPEYGPKGRAEMDSTLGQPVYVVPQEPQRPRLVCQSVIQDAVVLGVGEFEAPEELEVTPLPADPNAVAQPIPQEEQQQPVEKPDPDVITLVVSPQDAVSMNYMLLSGVKLSLALRNPTDANPYITDAVTQQYLMDQKNIPLPAKLPYSVEPRVDVLSFPGESVAPLGQQGQ